MVQFLMSIIEFRKILNRTRLDQMKIDSLEMKKLALGIGIDETVNEKLFSFTVSLFHCYCYNYYLPQWGCSIVQLISAIRNRELPEISGKGGTGKGY